MTLLVNVMRFYFKYHCYGNLFGFLCGGFYAFILDILILFQRLLLDFGMNYEI
jgi:hypothetical protein